MPRGEKIVYINPSWDGSKIAVGISRGDTDEAKIKIFNLKSKSFLDYEFNNSLPNVLGGVEWLPNNQGIIYTYVPVVNPQDENHRLNSEVRLCSWETGILKTSTLFSKEIAALNNFDFNSRNFPIAYIQDPASTYIICAIANTDSYRDTYFAKINDALSHKNKWSLLWTKNDKVQTFEVVEDDLFFLTSSENSFFDLSSINLNNAQPFEKQKVLFEGDPNNIIQELVVIDSNNVFAVTVKNGIEANVKHITPSSSENINLGFQAGRIDISKSGYNNSDLWIEAEGWTKPKLRLHYNTRSKELKSAELQENDLLGLNFGLTLEEIEIPATDGELVPLSIIYKKDLEFHKPRRLILAAYGSYGFTYSPRYYTFLHKWYEAGGIFAVAHVRGGDEKGEGWHKAGLKKTKSNTWNDVIDCSEFLINNGYTNSDNLVLYGASAGAIALGRAITERPDLYKAATIIVGSLNISRMVEYPSGRNAFAEFGNPNDELEKEYLKEMDPYLHIESGKNYPALYLTGGMQDLRVRPWQPAKFGAKIRANTSSKNPVLIKIDLDGGHGTAGNSTKFIRELAEIVSFSLWQTGHPDYQPISN